MLLSDGFVEFAGSVVLGVVSGVVVDGFSGVVSGGIGVAGSVGVVGSVGVAGSVGAVGVVGVAGCWAAGGVAAGSWAITMPGESIANIAS